MQDTLAISVRGARTNNLKNISVEIPLNKLTVITGVSGSGKSSLAFETLYAEGQRRYIESLSSYARQFLERIDKPEVDDILGLCPAIAIRQKNSVRNPRSTVATQTEIYDYLRLLFSRIGKTVCYSCNQIVRCDSPQTIADQLLPENTVYISFPANADENNLSPKARLIEFMQKGFVRLLRNGQIIHLTNLDDYPYQDLIDTYVIVDRLTIDSKDKSRLIDSLEICYKQANGEAHIFVLDKSRKPVKHLAFSSRFECKQCSISYLNPEPILFSFNNPLGACPTCQGFGNIIDIDLDLVIPNPELSIAAGAIEPLTKPQFQDDINELKNFCRRTGIALDKPFKNLPEEHRQMVINGAEDYRGIRGFFRKLESKKYKLHIRVLLSKYRGYTTCPDCNGKRLRREARLVKIAGLSIDEIAAMTVSQAATFFDLLHLDKQDLAIASRLLEEIRRRLRFLIDVGLDYLTLDRLASTLSGGESQRIQLATNLGSALVGTLYVLDEPSIGLHPRDEARLIQLLKRLRDIGNTVVVVEHDPAMIEAADYVIDLGPGAGEYGGCVTFQGPVEQLYKHDSSLTGLYLRSELQVRQPKTRRWLTSRKIIIRGAREHNLKNVDVELPLGMMICVTGVSGSGKSTLVHDVLYAGLKRLRGEWQGKVGRCDRIEGSEQVSDVIVVDQSPIGRTPRSNPVTYIKAYDAIRALFASTREAKLRGLTASHFSFNVPGGRCENCEGNGRITVEMQFLADVDLICEECDGTRFKKSVLEVTYKNKNINDVLNMTVTEALTFFHASSKITSRLSLLDAVGLGYLRLGQSATTLSGGEAQRLKLASYLTISAGASPLFIFDEPTTGLHFDDINKLLTAFERLLEAGASLIVIEHNLAVISAADWIVDLGPEGGDKGGYVVATGTPEQIAAAKASHTGKYLAAYSGVIDAASYKGR
ncbi:MAG: excinuclease ABC subunit UvrA [Acidobacteriota bacterium]|nr:excinuclease ABC subunit UvrA [Blastocatellia bacterium]MDW8412661.1 excinuclease ABC subunit UvrA [Acidobacteriota bacterium]